MIERISIENFVVLPHAEVELGSGLTAITGETGSGKTLIIGALLAAIGGDVSQSVVGPMGDQAWVEVEFQVPEGFWESPGIEALAELRPAGETTLVLARRILASGRTRAFAWGRSVSRADLQAAGALLVSVTGQHANHRLTLRPVQRQLLDQTGGAQHSALVAKAHQCWNDVGMAQTALQQIQSRASALSVRSAQIASDLELISSVEPSVADEEELLRSRAIARNAAELHSHLSDALGVLDGQGTGGGAVDALGSAWAHVNAAASIDEHHCDAAEVLLATQDSISEITGTLRSSIESLADAPGQIEQVEERLGAYDELHRRFGGTTASVLAAWQKLASDAELVTDLDGSLTRAQQALLDATERHSQASSALTKSRMLLADRLEAQVALELAELGMAHSIFTVALEPSAPGPQGAETVEFRIAPSAGMEPRSIAQVASGGELSRIALALHVSLAVHDTPTIIFDEIDAGIGGLTAHAVGTRLARIAQSGAQVLCVTHLAQVAAQSSGFVVIERTDSGTEVNVLRSEDQLVGELCRMVGAPVTDPSARSHAHNLRAGRFTASTDAR